MSPTNIQNNINKSFKIASMLGKTAIPTITLPQNLVINPGTVIEDFENAASWTFSGTAGGSLSDDLVNFKTGTKSLKITTANSSGNATATKTVNFTCDGNMQIWVYCNDSTLPSDGVIMASFAPADFSNYFQMWVNTGGNNYYNAPGWNLLNLRTSDWLVGAGTPNWSNPVRQLRFRFNSAATTHSYSVDSVTINKISKGVTLLTFDDGLDSQYDTVFPYLKAHRSRATMFSISSLVGGLGYISWDKLRNLYSNGWTIANHTDTTTNLNTLTELQQEATINTCDATLAASGIINRRKYIAFPSGVSDANTTTAMTNTGILAGRTILNFNITLPLTRPFFLPGRGIGSGITLATAQGYLDTAKSRQEATILYMHKVVDAPGAGDWYADRFRSLVDYAVAQDIPLITLDDLYQLQFGDIKIPKAV